MHEHLLNKRTVNPAHVHRRSKFFNISLLLLDFDGHGPRKWCKEMMNIKSFITSPSPAIDILTKSDGDPSNATWPSSTLAFRLATGPLLLLFSGLRGRTSFVQEFYFLPLPASSSRGMKRKLLPNFACMSDYYFNNL